MIAHLNGDFETVDYTGNRSFVMYDNIEDEDYPVHWHNAVEIIMPLVNDFKVICGEKEFLLNERDIIVIPAGELHTLKAGRGRRLIFLCNNAVLAENPALSDLYPVFSEPLLINKDYGDEFLNTMGKYITDIYTLYSNYGEMTEIYIYTKLLHMLTGIREYQRNAAVNEDKKFADKFRMILKYIDKNYMYDISLDSLASLAGYSKYHFSRTFKKESSSTFIELVNRRRIKAASVMLLEANLSITDIAMQSGFSSLTTFNRVFKKIKGCTPSEFKKMYKMSNTSENM